MFNTQKLSIIFVKALILHHSQIVLILILNTSANSKNTFKNETVSIASQRYWTKSKEIYSLPPHPLKFWNNTSFQDSV